MGLTSQLGQKIKSGLRLGLKVGKVGLVVAGGVLGAKVGEKIKEQRADSQAIRDLYSSDFLKQNSNTSNNFFTGI
eukprot:COSAG02_NODE_11935_length_1628_cov_635.321125_3_plen_75_part_00